METLDPNNFKKAEDLYALHYKEVRKFIEFWRITGYLDKVNPKTPPDLIAHQFLRDVISRVIFIQSGISIRSAIKEQKKESPEPEIISLSLLYLAITAGYQELDSDIRGRLTFKIHENAPGNILTTPLYRLYWNYVVSK
jgi:hypothetical protein